MLLKQKNSPYWYAVLYNGGNSRKWVSTRTKNKIDAKLFHDELEARYKKARAETRRRELLGLEASNQEPFLITDVLKRYKTVRGTPPQSTLAKFNRFVQWLHVNYPKIYDIREITKNIAFEYLSTYEKLSSKTYNNNKGCLSVIWSLLAVYDIYNIWQDIPRRTGGYETTYRAYTNKEVKQILMYCTGFHLEAVIIALYTGLRFKDICHLKLKDVNFKSEFIEIIPEKTKRFKKAVFIHLHSEVIKVLNKASAGKSDSDHFFPEAVAKYRSGTFGVQFKKILKKAKVEDNEHGKARFHSLRSTFITNCEEAGINRSVVQGIVGHGSPHMTERYSEDKKSGKILKQMPAIK
jgi:integrase